MGEGENYIKEAGQGLDGELFSTNISNQGLAIYDALKTKKAFHLSEKLKITSCESNYKERS